VGSDQGGTYENFYMATWDPKSLLFRGYLHVFVNILERQEWCRRNGTEFIMPVPYGSVQQIPVAQVAPAPPAYLQPTPPSGYQPPPGYALVPISEQPQVPPSAPPPYGYELKPIDP